jgi:hypothetical protein
MHQGASYPLLLPHCCHYRGGLIQGDRPSKDMSHLRCGVLVTPCGAPGCVLTGYRWVEGHRSLGSIAHTREVSQEKLPE